MSSEETKKSLASSSATTGSKGAFIVEDKDAEFQILWEVFQVDKEQKASKTLTWRNNMENDVRNAGFVDTHLTGNRHRPWNNVVSQRRGQERLGPGAKHQQEVGAGLEVFPWRNNPEF